MNAAVDLYWLPLGAGGHFVRLNGVIYEAVAARLGRRAPCDLYHSALDIRVGSETFVVEMAPLLGPPPELCGVVATGAVGARWAGRFRVFRYGIRRWPAGAIPDVAEAVGAPLRLTSDPECTRRLLELVPEVPTPVWGRDPVGIGDMWNSNSVVAWLIARSGIDTAPVKPPPGGRAPGWEAGLALAVPGRPHRE
jgi:hypothetical protein